MSYKERTRLARLVGCERSRVEMQDLIFLTPLHRACRFLYLSDCELNIKKDSCLYTRVGI